MTLLRLLIMLAATPVAPSTPSADTLRVTAEVMKEAARYFRQGINPEGATCEADRGEQCVGGPVPYPCRVDERCVFRTGLPEFVLKRALAHPDAGFVDGFATFLLVNSGRQLDAFRVATVCTAVAWWCSLIRGYVLNSVGRVAQAEREFHSALAAAPRSVRCEFMDPSWALPEAMRASLQGLPCDRRISVSDSIWWFADPSFTSPGNERWTEQIARMIYRRFHSVADSANRGYQDWMREWESAGILPRGQYDSWRKDRTYGGAHHHLLDVWTSRKAARYHFIPDFQGAGLSHPVWHLSGSIHEEGYTPPTTAFYEVPAQVARFRHGDSMVVAVAGTVSGTPMADAAAPTAHLILSDAPNSFPLRLSSALTDGRAVFLGRATAKRWVTSFEVLSEDGIGRRRVMLEPLQVQGPGVSDVLLYSPVGLDLPDSLRIAAGMMLGDTTVAKGDQLGIYWETYGARKGVPVSVELEIQREGGGLLSQLKDLVPGLGRDRSGRPRWTETSPGPVFRRALALDLSEVDPGDYTLVVKTSWPGQEAVETNRAFVVR